MEGQRALEAAREGDLATLELLLEAGALGPGITDALGAGLVHHASRAGHLDCVKFLVQRAKLPGTQRAHNGATPVHDAAATGGLAELCWLVRDGGCGLQVSRRGGLAASVHLAGVGQRSWARRLAGTALPLGSLRDLVVLSVPTRPRPQGQCETLGSPGPSAPASCTPLRCFLPAAGARGRVRAGKAGTEGLARLWGGRRRREPSGHRTILSRACPPGPLSVQSPLEQAKDLHAVGQPAVFPVEAAQEDLGSPTPCPLAPQCANSAPCPCWPCDNPKAGRAVPTPLLIGIGGESVWRKAASSRH